MTVIAVTNHFLVRFEAHTPGEIHSWYYKPGQKPTNGEVTCLREGKLALVALLNEHGVK